jgi:nucleotide-binding universal stress UspA family protein
MPRFRTILHPTDLSEPSEAALAVARSLAEEGGDRLVILHVLPDAVAAGVDVVLPIDPEAARAALAEVQPPAGPEGRVCSLETLVSQGEPAQEILRVARQTGADLIVMGSQGRSGLARAILGSVAEHVLRGASCPVLVVRPPARGSGPLRFRTILVPTDFSAGAEAALREAVALALVHGGRIAVLHIPHADEPAVWVYDRMAGGEADPDLLLARLERRTAPYRAQNPQVLFEHRLREGSPAEEILREAEARRPDLIVLGTRGRSGLDRMLMGSVAEEVIRGAACPVLAVRHPDTSGAPAQADVETGRPSHA